MEEDAKTVMVLMKQGGRTISGIEQAEKLTSRDRHELIQTEIRECIRETVKVLSGQWVTIHEIVKLAKLRYPDMAPYFENKSIAEYLKFMVIHQKKNMTVYKCERRSTVPIPLTNGSQTSVYEHLWLVVESLHGFWTTAENISRLACAQYPDMQDKFQKKSVVEYLKFMGLDKKEIKTTRYFCMIP